MSFLKAKKNIFRFLHANLLVNGLLEMLIVHNSSHFSITVGGPIGSGNFHTRFTGINSEKETKHYSHYLTTNYFFVHTYCLVC